MNLGSVFALEADFRGFAKLKLIHQRIVLMRELRKFRNAAHDLSGVHLAGTIVVARNRHGALPGTMTRPQHNRFVCDPHGASTADRNTRAVGGHVISHDGEDVLAIITPTRLRNAAVERLARGPAR